MGGVTDVMIESRGILSSIEIVAEGKADDKWKVVWDSVQ